MVSNNGLHNSGLGQVYWLHVCPPVYITPTHNISLGASY